MNECLGFIASVDLNIRYKMFSHLFIYLSLVGYGRSGHVCFKAFAQCWNTQPQVAHTSLWPTGHWQQHNQQVGLVWWDAVKSCFAVQAVAAGSWNMGATGTCRSRAQWPGPEQGKLR